MALTMIGKVINNRYRIDEELGRGGMGVVYKAWDLLLKRYVALKMIKPDSPEKEQALKRFRDEAIKWARLEPHPNIVTLHDFFMHENDSFIVMEYVEGTTLDKKLERDGALPFHEATPIIKQMLAAVGHAHKAGIIHRDLKPGNVMIKSDGQAKVMDFGLAKDQTRSDASRSTKTEHTGGTLYYLSPEQVNGKPVDQRSDIYSLGITCYEVLAGYMPLKGKTTTVEILDAIRRDHFPPPTKFNRDVPKKLSKVVEKAIELKPRRRFQSAGEMLAEVKKFEEEQKKDEKPSAVKRRWIRLVLEITWGIISVALVVALITIIAVPDLPLRILRWTGIQSSTKVAIYTEPAGAKIKFKDKSVGKSPLRSRLVDVDTLQVSIEESTYFSIDTSIVVKGVTDTTLVFILKPAAIFAVEAVPESAEVMLDGKIIPSAEREHIELAVGDHDLLITSEGYETINEKIFLRHGLNPPRLDTLKQVRIAALSTPPPKVKSKPPEKSALKDSVDKSASVVETRPRTGILTLAVNPASDVYIGDSLAAKAVTQSSFTLPLGTYAIKVVHATSSRWLKDIYMTEQGVFREIDFTKKYTIRVLAFDSTNGERIAAAIYLDNHATGKVTPDKLSLNFGYHEIEARLEGFEPERREFNVEKDDKFEFMLKRVQ